MNLYLPKLASGSYITVEIEGGTFLAAYSTKDLAIQKLRSSYPSDFAAVVESLLAEDVLSIARKVQLQGVAIDDQRVDY